MDTASHLTRGAWIEILNEQDTIKIHSRSHLTRGAWIEIFFVVKNEKRICSRTSHEVRGLKYLSVLAFLPVLQVAPHTRCVD